MKDQLYDDKNFIFNSQNQFGFSSTSGYNFIDKRYNKHQRGIGNNKRFMDQAYDRDTLREMISLNN